MNEEDRTQLIKTAVNFLKNPNVEGTSDSSKRSFLASKGLKVDEIEQAYESSGLTQPDNADHRSALQPLTSGYSQDVPYQVPTRWTYIRDSLSLLFIAGGATYSIYRLYHDVIKPLISGQQSCDGYETMHAELRTLHESMRDTLTAVQRTLITVQSTLDRQQGQIDAISSSLASHKIVGETPAVEEIKTEITSLKSLLLNRHQFQPNPTCTSVLPSWQLCQDDQQPLDQSHNAVACNQENDILKQDDVFSQENINKTEMLGLFNHSDVHDTNNKTE